MDTLGFSMQVKPKVDDLKQKISDLDVNFRMLADNQMDRRLFVFGGAIQN